MHNKFSEYGYHFVDYYILQCMDIHNIIVLTTQQGKADGNKQTAQRSRKQAPQP